MTISIASARCVLQVALLGSVTSNLRAVSATFIESDFMIYFYYHEEPSEQEIDLSEIVSTEVISDFINITAEVERIVIPEPERIPLKENGIWVYYRYEEYLKDD